MAMFRLNDAEFDVGEYSHERVLWVDILSGGERFFSEPIDLDNQKRNNKPIELVRRSEATVELVFNCGLHRMGSLLGQKFDIILRDIEGIAIASAFNVGTVR